MIQARVLRKVKRTYLLAIFLLLMVLVVSIATGFASLTPSELLKTLAGQGTPKQNLILYEFRLPRILVSILAGMGLAVSGGILQSMTRNPLADPGILGINAGAGFMVVIYVMFFSVGSTNSIYILPLFALAGGFAAAVTIYILAYKKSEGTDPARLILVGVGMAAAVSGGILTLSTRLEREEYEFFSSWMAGKVWGDDWNFVIALLPWILILVPYVFRKSKVLNMLVLHEHIAVGTGVSVERERQKLMFIAAALASAAVSVSGGIAFLGLMAPHIARGLAGPRHEFFLPLTALIGSVLLLAADTIGRVILDPSGIPAGIIVTIVGAPYFMYLMAKRR